MIQVVQLLEEFGPTLTFPFSSHIEGKLRELRTQYGKSKLRILYYADVNRAFVLLHGTKKKTQKLPEENKKLALNHMAIDMEQLFFISARGEERKITSMNLCKCTSQALRISKKFLRPSHTNKTYAFSEVLQN